MSAIRHFYRLVRGTNLLIIVLSMSFFRYFELTKMFEMVHRQPTLDTFHFALLCLAVVLIAAGGNVVNDYLDFANDKQFKPHKKTIGEWISLDQAFYLQAMLSLVGILLGYYLAYKIGNWQLGNIFSITAVILWLYSVVLKGWFLVGNIVVALLSGFVFVLVVLFEPTLWDMSLPVELKTFFSPIVVKVQVYAAFAFMTSLVREIVKDAEDKAADASRNMNTLPILFSTKLTNFVILSLIYVMIIGLGALSFYLYKLGMKNQVWYILLALIFTLFINSFTVFVSKSKEDYRNLSIYLKLNMLFGIFSMPIFYYSNLYFPL